MIATKSSFMMKLLRKDTQNNVINHFETSKTGLSKCTHLPSNAETTSSSNKWHLHWYPAQYGTVCNFFLNLYERIKVRKL